MATTEAPPVAEVQTIGPAEAEAMLDANPVNRKLGERRVKRLARAMSEGEWQFNGETVKVATDGSLLDGQHRLAAVVLSGTSQPFLVVRGLEPDIQETVDTGKARNVGDMLSLRGYANATSLASGATGIYCYTRYGVPSPKVLSEELRPTPQEVLATVDEHPGLSASASQAEATYSRSKLVPPSLFTTLHYLFQATDPESTTDFFERLADGANLAPGRPVHTLRERLLRDSNAARASRLAYGPKAAFVVTAFNAYRAGERLERLQWRPAGTRAERFPLVRECPLNPGEEGVAAGAGDAE